MLFTLFLFAGLSAYDLPEASHEAMTDSLRAVTVTTDKGVVVSKTDTLSVANSFSVSDVLSQSPSLHVGDNGGAAGLKTVSLRGLGSAHTSVYIDGVRVGNVQSGQNDLGMSGIEGVSSVVVDYARNSISFNTSRPEFINGPTTGTIRLHAGSFDTWQPYASFGFRLTENISLSANASGLFSKGDFGYSDGLVRQNNDLEQIRAGLDIFGLSESGDYHIKAYYNSSDRGTPGPTDWPSEDRQADRNLFLQGVLNKAFSPSYTMRLSGKFSSDDISYSSSWGDSKYAQKEYQLNSSHGFRIRRWWKMSFDADVQWDALTSDAYDASRLTAFSALASSFRFRGFSADVALEYSGAFDTDGLSRNAWSPSASMRMTVLEGLEFHAFARHACRIPTFNELYYAGYGNPELRPEDAWLTDIGMEYCRSFNGGWTFKASVDVFYNALTDKITSAPTPEDPAIWQPYNIGRVRSEGADAGFVLIHDGVWDWSLDMKYSFLSAVDRTEGSEDYGHQIPYIAKHSLMLSGKLSWKDWTLAPIWQMKAGRKDGYGEMPSWNTLDLNLSKKILRVGTGNMLLRLSIKNIFDCRYELVSGYPMQGRSIISGIEYRF